MYSLILTLVQVPAQVSMVMGFIDGMALALIQVDMLYYVLDIQIVLELGSVKIVGEQDGAICKDSF